MQRFFDRAASEVPPSCARRKRECLPGATLPLHYLASKMLWPWYNATVPARCCPGFLVSRAARATSQPLNLRDQLKREGNRQTVVLRCHRWGPLHEAMRLLQDSVERRSCSPPRAALQTLQSLPPFHSSRLTRLKLATWSRATHQRT